MPSYKYDCRCGYREKKEEPAGWERQVECPECGKTMTRYFLVTTLPVIRRYSTGDLDALAGGYY